jgi:hypothetical protein
MRIFETVKNSVATVCHDCGRVCVSVVEIKNKSVLCLVCSLGELLITRHHFSDKAKVLDILRNLSQNANRSNFSNGLRQLKLGLKCSECGQDGQGHKLELFAAYGLQFAHLDRATKLRTNTGRVIDPSRIIRDGYSLAVAVMQLLILSRVLCAYCHALETAYENTNGGE